jgi:hypothetical protein
MITTTPLDHVPSAAAPDAGDVPAVTIRAVWPDREHALIGVVGAATDADSLVELRERVEALLIGGVRHLLVDLSEAQAFDRPVRALLADAAARLADRSGWLRIHPGFDEAAPPNPDVDDATLPDLFVIYRAMARGTADQAQDRLPRRRATAPPAT